MMIILFPGRFLRYKKIPSGTPIMEAKITAEEEIFNESKAKGITSFHMVITISFLGKLLDSSLQGGNSLISPVQETS